ncbi:MAG: RdgB/HAM1 family non-canonical purine NTP pyrophosphatase [Myxococcota bacterium]|jgi:XTP/dITP diphosphohydrolase|nr:RdgB/HAM1 family non-canonical purine NTP pyrophosphatase [Myxococcota bacterium]
MSAKKTSLLYIATNNAHKLKEFSQLLSPHGFVLKSAADLGLNDIPEEGHSFAENALQKAHTVFHACGLPTLADDSGLEVDALDGAPGIYSARYAGTHDNQDQANRHKLLRELQGLPKEQRSAHFRCALAFCADNTQEIFEGRLSGHITLEERGAGGFGYDMLFQADGQNVTLAEISQDAKNAISHRRKALNAFLNYYENTSKFTL